MPIWGYFCTRNPTRLLKLDYEKITLSCISRIHYTKGVNSSQSDLSSVGEQFRIAIRFVITSYPRHRYHDIILVLAYHHGMDWNNTKKKTDEKINGSR